MVVDVEERVPPGVATAARFLLDVVAALASGGARVGGVRRALGDRVESVNKRDET